MKGFMTGGALEAPYESNCPPCQADGTSKLILPPRISTSTGSVSGTGTLLGATHTNQIGGEPGSPTFDPLAQTLSSSSTALLEVELQRLMRTW